MTTTRVSGCRFWISRRVSIPSTSGIQMSSRTSCGRSLAITASAARPLSASSTRNPSSASTPRTLARICSSSSTIRMVSAMELALYWKFDDESTPLRLVVAHADERAVVGEDRGNDRQSESATFLFSREVGLEQTRLHLGRHARPVVGELEANQPERLEIRRRNLDPPALAVAVGARGNGVVQHVDQRAFDPLAVEHQRRHVRVGTHIETDLAVPFAKQHDGLVDETVQILGAMAPGRQAREARKLVHQRLQVLHLLDDRPRALLEHVFMHDLPVTLLQA